MEVGEDEKLNGLRIACGKAYVLSKISFLI